MFHTHTLRSLTVFASAALVLASLLTTDVMARTWTNARGLSFEAEFVRLSGEMIVVRQNGETVVLEMRDLSASDQDWAKAKDASGRTRSWKLRDGAVVRGRYLRVEGDGLLISSREGRKMLPLAKLSDADRQLIAVLNNMAKGQMPAAIDPASEDDASPFGADRSAGQEREWTATNGRKITAEYRGLEGLKVVLFCKGREWRVPLSKLSTADQRFIESLHAKTDVVMFDDLEAEEEDEPKTPYMAMGTPAATPDRQTLATSTSAAPLGRWDWATLNAEFGGHGLRVRSRLGKQRVWIDNAEVFGEEAERAIAYLEMSEERDQQKSSSRQAIIDNAPQQFERNAADKRKQEIERKRNERRRQREEQLELKRLEREQRALASTAETGPSPRSQSESAPVSEPLMHSYVCFSCDKEFSKTRELKVGDKCPHCRVTFDQLTDENGEVVAESARATGRRYRGIIKLVIFGVMGLGGFLGWLSRN